jgi:hypothetical protein
MSSERQDVFAARAQGGQSEIDDVEPVVEILGKQAPWGSRLAARICPPADSTIDRVMERPRPRCSACQLWPAHPVFERVVKPVSKILSSDLGGIPKPLSSKFSRSRCSCAGPDEHSRRMS